jgi:aryl-alcohol dehydrogenase-like predicted oxidoreductase
MAHNADNLITDTNRYLWQTMSALKGYDLVSKIGASVYTADQIDHLIERYNLDIIQVPLSIFDQRLIGSGHLKKLKARGVEVHVRSVFLQGLLLMSPEDAPAGLSKVVPYLRQWREALAIEGISPVTAALDFVLSRKEVDRAVVGVCNVEQLRELETVGLQHDRQSTGFWSRFAIADESILNPALWTEDR